MAWHTGIASVMSEHAGCSFRMTGLLSYLRSLTTTGVLVTATNKIVAALLRWVRFRSGDLLSLVGDVLCYSRSVDLPMQVNSFAPQQPGHIPAPEIVQPTQPEAPSGSMANVSAKCDVMSPGSDPAESSPDTGSKPASHTHFVVVSAPCARVGSPLVPDSRTCAQLARVVAAKEWHESI